MITRRAAIVLSTKGLAALMAAAPHLSGCTRRTKDGIDTGSWSPGDQPKEIDTASTDTASTDTASTDTASTDTASTDTGSPELLDWESFLTALATLAETQFSEDWNQETYVVEVLALMRLLDQGDEIFETLYDGYVSAMGTFPEISSAHDGGYFEVVTLEFDPGDAIPLHNHPDMTGAILCISGRVEVESFNLLDELSPEGRLLIEQVDQLELSPGLSATLTAQRGNIHALVATQYTELLDVFTPPYDDERLTRYRWYERASEPIDGGSVFEAWET